MCTGTRPGGSCPQGHGPLPLHPSIISCMQRVCMDKHSYEAQSLRHHLILLMLSFARPGCLIAIGLVILLLLLISFFRLWVLIYLRRLCFIYRPSLVGICLSSLSLDLPGITRRDLQEVAKAKKSTAGGLDGWAWNEVKALPLPWFSGLAILLEYG